MFLIKRLMFLKVCNSMTLLKSVFSERFCTLVVMSQYVCLLAERRIYV